MMWTTFLQIFRLLLLPHHQWNCNLQLNLYDLVSRFKQNHVFFCRLYKESFEKTRHGLVSFFDIYTWNLMLKPEKFDAEMTEISGITGNEWCLVLLLQYFPFQTASTIYSCYLSTKSTNVSLLSCLWDILRSRAEANATCCRLLLAQSNCHHLWPLSWLWFDDNHRSHGRLQEGGKTGICPAPGNWTQKQNFLENVKSAAQFRLIDLFLQWQFICQ